MEISVESQIAWVILCLSPARQIWRGQAMSNSLKAFGGYIHTIENGRRPVFPSTVGLY